MTSIDRRHLVLSVAALTALAASRAASRRHRAPSASRFVSSCPKAWAAGRTSPRA